MDTEAKVAWDGVADLRAISTSLGSDPEPHDGGWRWWVRGVPTSWEPTDPHLVVTRRLHQMRRPLPAAEPDLPTRAFDPERDVERWLEVNNAAFARHPDQGDWDRPRLEARLAESWVEIEGIRVHDGPDGQLVGFCWTRFHPATAADPDLGEIFVIAVDPSQHRRGLGRQLALAGLDWQWRHHRPPVGMLWVDHDNTAALRSYRSLDFTIHHDDVAVELAP